MRNWYLTNNVDMNYNYYSYLYKIVFLLVKLRRISLVCM